MMIEPLSLPNISAPIFGKTLPVMESKCNITDTAETVVDLDDQLARAVERRAQLEEEIRQGVALLAQNPSWNRLPLPVDILIFILFHVIASDPRSIGSYLFVCRDWYSVIMSTPVLWSVISVVAPSEENKLASLTAYCRACIQRSCSAPLDITVDYRELYDLDVSSIREITSKAGARRLKRLEFDCFVELNVLARLPRAFGTKYLEQCAGPIRELVGPHGSEVSRWRRFTFYAAEPRKAYTFDYLRSVLRHGFSKQSIGSKKKDVFDFAHYMVYDSSDQSQPPQLPPDVVARMHQPSPVLLDPLCIHELEVTCKDPQSLRRVLQFRRLVHLTIGVRVSYPQRFLDAQMKLRRGDVYFPSLLTLTVHPKLPLSFWKYLDAPCLVAIRLHILEVAEQIPQEVNVLPSLQRIEFRCMHENLGAKRVAVFLPSCPNLHTIICFVERLEVFVRAIQAIGPQAVFRSSLRQILSETWQGSIMSSPLRPTYELVGNETSVHVRTLFVA